MTIITFGSLPSKQRKRLESGHCPDCGGQLLGGPSGGAGQNCACSHCRMEFVIMPFGFTRNGKIGHQRAQSIYGMDQEPESIRLVLAPKKPFWKRWLNRR